MDTSFRRVVARISSCLAVAAVAALCGCESEQSQRKRLGAAAGSLRTLIVVADQAPVRADEEVVATVGKGRLFGVVASDGDLLKIQVCVGAGIVRGWVEGRHVRLLADADLDLGLEALKIARGLDPKADIRACKAALDALAERVAAVAKPGKTPKGRARLVGEQLFEREGFAAAEGAPDRLDLVLLGKKGGSLGLSVLYLCATRNLEMPFCLVSAPGYAYVRYDDGFDRFNIDPATGGSLHETDDFLQKRLGYRAALRAGGIHQLTLSKARALGVLLRDCGNTLARQGNDAEACAEYAKAAEINPQEVQAYCDWGRSLGRLGRRAEAHDRFAKALEISPRDPDVLTLVGNALAGVGEQAAACKHFEKAIDIDPKFAKAYAGWGATLRSMGNAAEACDKLAVAVELDPQGAQALLDWARALADLGRRSDALEKLAKATELDPALKPEAEKVRDRLPKKD